MGIIARLRGSEPSRRIGPGTKVTVYTPENWKGDGTGGVPGEVMEADGWGYEVMWTNSEGVTKVDSFDRDSRRAKNEALQAWFQRRDEPFATAPEFPLNTPPIFSKEV